MSQSPTCIKYMSDMFRERAERIRKGELDSLIEVLLRASREDRVRHVAAAIYELAARMKTLETDLAKLRAEMRQRP